MAAMLLPTALVAQTDVEELGRRHGAKPPPGYYATLRSMPDAFQFSRHNGWIRRGRSVAAARSRIRGRTAAGLLQRRPAQVATGVVGGAVNVPVFLILFSNTDSASLVTGVPQSAIERRLYGTDPAPPYSVHTYYRELSNDLLFVNGTVFDWTRVPGTDSSYEGNANGLDSSGDIPGLISDIATALDDTVDFGEFDNDGPDGIPNSADDDGFVDAVVLIHPKVDGSCKAVSSDAERSIWAHRFRSSAWFRGDPFATNDVANSTSAEFSNIRIDDYIIQGGQGGDDGCTSHEPQAMGVVAHETGHLFGLPDLYDTGGSGFGIGRWGLMGFGNQQEPTRPAHMSAWAKAELGWVTEVLIDGDTTLQVSPVEISDTTYVLPIPQTHEYFILENRQRIGSDAFLIEEGLLIWHVDSFQVRLRREFNIVNAFAPYAVALEQADGRDDLMSGTNRADVTDPFPGGSRNVTFGRNTTPSSLANNGSQSFVELDSIEQVGRTGPIRVRIAFERPVFIAATDTNAVFRLDDVDHNRFNDFLTSGQHTLEMDDVQLVDQGRRQYAWISWSNGQPRSHTFTASLTGDTIIASVEAAFRLQATVSGSGGSIAADVSIDLANGTLLPEDSVVTLMATVDSAGFVFEGWLGSDTVAAADTLVLRMHRPFTVDALFAAPLVTANQALPEAVMGTPYTHQLVATGGVGFQSWRLAGGALPTGLDLRSEGVIAGLPEETGEFPIDVEVFSGSQVTVDSVTVSVVAPALTVTDVLRNLTGDGRPLSPQDVKYLDLLGNQNSGLDVGDFLAWIEETGGAVSAEAIAAALAVALEETERDPVQASLPKRRTP